MLARPQSRIAITATCAVILVVSLAPAGASAGSPASPGAVAHGAQNCGWKVVSSPRVNAAERHGTLVAVDAVSSRNVWTVGKSLEHWNGSSWTVYKPVRTESGQYLTAITAITSKDVFVVGGDSYAGGLIDRWNGYRWTKVYSPNPNPRFGPKVDVLNAVSGLRAHDVWAAGGQPVSDDDDTAYALHRNGRKWIGMALPSGPDTPYPNPIDGVAAVSSRYVLVVSNSGYAAVWNGKRWTEVASPVYANAITALSKDDAWAVGFSPTAVIDHWNGVKWSPSPLTLPVGWSAELESVSAGGPDDVWAVGQMETGSPHDVHERVLVAHWNGTDWTLSPSPAVQGTFMQLNGVSVLSNGDAWAVGWPGKVVSYSKLRPLIEHYVHC